MIVADNKENSVFSVYDPYGVKLLTRLRLQFSHLKEHKFRHGFGDTASPMCGCNAEIEDTEHFLLRCHFYSIQRFELFNNINIFIKFGKILSSRVLSFYHLIVL